MRAKRRDVGVASLLVVVTVLLFYIGDLPWPGSSQLRDGFLFGQAYHELCLLALIGPVVYSSICCRVRGGIAVAIVVSLGILPHTFYFSPYTDPYFRLATFTIISLLLAGFIGGQLNKREEVEREQSRLERFLSQTIGAQERERRYLGRELHDETAQALVDISHEIDEIVETGGVKTETADRLNQLRSHVDEVLEGTRRFIRGLRPPLLEEMGLGASLKSLADEVAEDAGIEVKTDIRDEETRLSDTQELALFRVAQEALTNGKKYSNASKIWVSLAISNDKAELLVQDNGQGFSVPSRDSLEKEGKFGLIGMRERARLAGGRVQVQSAAGKGTTVVAQVPLLR